MLDNIGKHYILNGKICISSEYKQQLYTNRVYDVVRIIDGGPLFLQDHYKRLQDSAALIGKTLPMDYKKVSTDIQELIKTEDILNNNIVIIAYFKDDKSWYVIYFRKSFYPCIDMYKNGVETSMFNFTRLIPNAKILNLKYRKAMKEEIQKMKVFEVILVDGNGFVTEGSKTNIFFYKNGMFYTPPGDTVLKGITRKYVIQIIKECDYPICEEMITEKEINGFEGAFLTGTSVGVLPIRQIDDIVYNSGNIDEICDIHKHYNNLVKTIVKKCAEG